MKFSKIIGLPCTLLLSANIFAHGWDSSRPDSHAPISVMGDHTHKTGETMLSYRRMSMDMDSLADGSSSVSSSHLLENSSYMMAPTKMTMTMDMLGAMYAPTDSTTLMMMAVYHDNEMEMDMKMSGSMGGVMNQSMNSSGVGDLKLGALHSIYNSSKHKVHLNLIMSLPTGSIDEKINGQALPYAMQLGSGTYDLLPGITYAAQYDRFSWGAQATATVRLAENDQDYTLGNRYQFQSWVQKPVLKIASITARVAYENWQNIDGEDDRLNPMVSPSADANLQAGEMIIAGVGINITLPEGNRLALEYNKQVEQNLDGPQMEFDDSLTMGWQLSFK